MKKLYLLFIFTILILSCSDEAPNSDMPYLGALNSLVIESPNDPSYVITFSVDPNNQDGFYAILKHNGDIEKYEYIPYFIVEDVNIGYGETSDIKCSFSGALFVEDEYLILQSSENTADSYNYISILDKDFKLKKGLEINNIDGHLVLSQWEGDVYAVCISKGSLGSEIRWYREDQQLRVNTYQPNSGFNNFVTRTNRFFVCGEEEYVEYTDNLMIKRSLLDSNSLWMLSFEYFVKDPSGDVEHKPKTKFVGYKIKGDTVSIDLDVTYYNGDKESIKLNVDLNTGQVI